MTIVRQDTFAGRTVASGWGTASDGNAWTIQSGNGQNVGTSQADEGAIVSSTTSTFATLGNALSGADAEGVVRFQAKDITHNTAGILLRWTDANNHWLGRFNGADAAGPAINVMCKVGGAYTSQVSKTLVSLGVTLNNTSFYWLKFRCEGTTISIKIWQDGTGEPGWSQQFTGLSTQNTAGKVGLYGFGSGGNPTYYDTYSVDDLGASSSNFNQSKTDAQSATAQTILKVVMAPRSETESATDAVTTLLGSVLTKSVTDAHSGTDAQTTGVLLHPGTGIGGIVRSTGSQTWNFSGNGYGTGDVTGTEFDYIYRDSTSSGWAIGAIPAYGGMPIAAWYQIDGATALNTSLPQRTSATGNMMTLLTTQAGGIVHWEEEVGSTFAASENPTFKNAGNFSEMAPVGTDFRAYIKAVADNADANGVSWTSYACMYPGDPGLVTFRFDQKNGTGSTILLDESDIELIASLLGDTGVKPVGIWNMTSGYIGTIGGGTTQWKNVNNRNTGTFDYVYITPDTTQSTITLGTGACVLQDPSAQFSWNTGSQAGWRVADSGPSATKPTRIKQGFYTGTVGNWNFPAGTTNTYYVLRVFKRNLTNADMQAIAADWKFPGTPSVSVGTYSTFSYDEKAYVGSTSGNLFKVTLDLSPANVTRRYKPVFKITNWTDSNPPVLTWGGSALAGNADYRYYNDTANQVLYLQMWFDVVASGAASGEKDNAELAVSAPTVGLTQTTSEQHAGTDLQTLSTRLLRQEAESALDTLLLAMLRTQLDGLSATDVVSALLALSVTVTDQESARDALTKLMTSLAVDSTSLLEHLTRSTVFYLREQQSAVDLSLAGRTLLMSVMEALGWADNPTAVLANPVGHQTLAIATSLIATSLGMTVTLSSTNQLGITFSSMVA